HGRRDQEKYPRPARSVKPVDAPAPQGPEVAPMLRRLLRPDPVGFPASVGLLLLRISVGGALAHHGWPKIQDPFGWMGPKAEMPGVLQACAALAEFGGGIALVFGLLTRLAAFGTTVNMAVAIGTVHLPAGDPFVAAKGGPSWELAAVYCAASLLF